jgi:acetylglutamate kinase
MKKLYIIKIGGDVIDDPNALEKFLVDFSKIQELKILVHGGGKIASELAKRLGISQALVNGRRITDAETLKITTMVYAGLINKQIVASLQANGVNAIGLSGADGNSIISVKRNVIDIDYGFVGDVNSSGVNSGFINLLLSVNVTPVFSAITHDGNGQLLNTNADTIASVLAVAMAKHFDVQLNYCFEKKCR